MSHPRRSFLKTPVCIAFLPLLALLLAGWTKPGEPLVPASDPFPGNPPITPRWAFEPWVWEDNTNTQASTLNLVNGYTSRDIPVGAVIVDSPWETDYNTFEWDRTQYWDPQGMIDGLHSRGIRVVLWITGFVNINSPDYEYVKSQGFTVSNGQDFNWWKGRGVHIDFTNENAKNWWHSKMDNVLNMGIDGWKVDQSPDKVSDPVLTSIGRLSKAEFKRYYYADFFDYSISRNSQAVILARPFSMGQSGLGASVSKLSVGWSGDHSGDFKGLNHQKNEVYESAIRGFGAPGVEVGGYFWAMPTRSSLIRYAQLGALLPLMENGGNNGGKKEHLPWYWDSATTDIYRYFATLHSELAPYLFSYSVEAHHTGVSIVRSPDKGKSHHLLGEELFVSVINSDVVSKTVSFPPDSLWIDYWNEASVYTGGIAADYEASLNRYPLFIRAGAVIPMNIRSSLTGHGDSSSSGKTTLLVYPYGSSSFTFHRPLGDGIEYTDVTVSVDEFQGTISVDGDIPADYRLRVKSFSQPASVSGADSWQYDPAAQVVVIDKAGQDFTIIIQGLWGYGGLSSPPQLDATESSPPFSQYFFLPYLTKKNP